ncbi:6-phosphogluconolactonase [Intrasporangium sp.]|uniref:6-phosphogluconolactonase n=1 Tax=Intrasporangium sp. TaxID=1925024 RepID=UPI00293B2ED3|nr:6-phosphogluconolactonase [Intrasporangium sp.]MDV3221216.1 6-phosphogluconolactonase [Intrasporangium sp.]
MTPEPVVVVHPDQQSLADAAAARLVVALVDAQTRSPEAQIALTGGSLGSQIITSLTQVPGRSAVDWDRVRVWWGDERYLPRGDADRNDTQNDAAGLSTLGLDEAKVHRVPGPDDSDSAEASADAYAQTLRDHGAGAFDVVILGVGPDGHVASLFPHHDAQRATGTPAVAVHNSPKPPPDRVSLTFECLARAREVWFLVAGADKAEAVAAALSPGTDRWDVPASAPKGTEATRWLVDAAAAARLR